MKAMVLSRIVPLPGNEAPLQLVDLPAPQPEKRSPICARAGAW